MKLEANSIAETESLGAKLWQVLPKKSLIFLNGELGAGKTTLVRGVLRAAGYQGAVKSPTFTLVEEYQLTPDKILHFDLYRVNDPEELEWIGIRDYLAQTSLCFIEWAELGKGFLPQPDVIINLAVKGEGRSVEMIFNCEINENIFYV